MSASRAKAIRRAAAGIALTLSLGACSRSTPEKDPRAYARSVYALRCAACHGATGAGDTRTGVAMPSFRDADWQARTADAQIERAIAGGGAAVGKSAVMPANPDLAGSPVLLAAMRDHIRSFASK